MSVAFNLDLDLDLMVGEMPAPPCESPHHHENPDCHDGEATHYAVTGHACFGPVGPVFAICGAYAAYWQERGFVVSLCLWCDGYVSEAEYVKVVAAINT